MAVSLSQRVSSMTERKPFGVRMDCALMVQLQPVAMDQEKYVNETLEEEAKDFLKKYREKRT